MNDQKVLRWFSLWIPITWLTGCSFFVPKAEDPMPVYVHGDPAEASELVVLMPGIRGTPQHFVDSGFVEDAGAWVNSREWALLAVDAHWGYYKSRTLEVRMLEDVLARWPDKPVTLVGISLGGLGSLLIAPELQGRVKQIVLFAPFLGEDANRLPPPADKDKGPHEALHKVWPYLLDAERDVPIHLAWGTDDKFAPAYAVLRQQQPKNISWDAIAGDHRWPVWRELWQRWLAGLN